MGIDPVSVLVNAGASIDPSYVIPIWGGFLMLVRALISALNRAYNFDPDKLPRA